ncbi:MAG: amino acid ABC transporter ATP-binding protein [Bacteroidia bacterium]|nr:amino acid ABC transporter ATP-binding protein [Bacteroidia bacterium]
MESPILTLNHVNKYYGETQALADIQLDVAKGEVVTIIGQSGCGKSTALRCINGLEEIQSGSILLDGKEIAAAGTNWKEVRQKIGMVFQFERDGCPSPCAACGESTARACLGILGEMPVCIPCSGYER